MTTESRIEKESGLKTSSVDRQSALLKGLEALGQYYSLGLDKRSFLDELRYLEAEAKYNAECLGQVQKKEKATLDIVNDLRRVDEIVERFGYEQSALLQILLDIQTEMRWLPRHVLKWVSSCLNVPLARTYSIAHFYEALSLKPCGKHLIQVCTGTACHVRGASSLLERVSAILKIGPDQTDSKQMFTLKTVHCMGCCALAPVMKIDGDYYSNPSIKEMRKLFESYEKQESSI